MLKKKPFIETNKATAEKQLAALVEKMTADGKTAAEIQRDTKIRHCHGLIRQAKKQLASIAAIENQTARMAEAKAEKLAAPKVSAPKKKAAPEPVKKKAKKEKTAAPAEADE